MSLRLNLIISTSSSSRLSSNGYVLSQINTRTKNPFIMQNPPSPRAHLEASQIRAVHSQTTQAIFAYFHQLADNVMCPDRGQIFHRKYIHTSKYWKNLNGSSRMQHMGCAHVGWLYQNFTHPARPRNLGGKSRRKLSGPWRDGDVRRTYPTASSSGVGAAAASAPQGVTNSTRTSPSSSRPSASRGPPTTEDLLPVLEASSGPRSRRAPLTTRSPFN
ncbi:unnamed protein product [Nesidiocoris tenuis]|uniref:Uncharacterized protein n=1 Tax=Nesidiocoris tenuis TaxID=355587 RepID=A0A6H5GI03_9HEMI|nr:unnamed protein product [Nesidiocoris tenuis]